MELLVVLSFMLSVLSACKTKYVSVPEYHTEYISRTDSFIKTDSVYFKDSVFIIQRGDTVYYNKVVYKDRFRDVFKFKTDTVLKTDSVRIPYPVIRELSKSERRLISIGKYSIAIAIFAAALGAFVLWYRNKRR